MIGVRFAGAVLGERPDVVGSVLYPTTRPGEARWNISPLADQGAAGRDDDGRGRLRHPGALAWLFFEWRDAGHREQRAARPRRRDGRRRSTERAPRARSPPGRGRGSRSASWAKRAVTRSRQPLPLRARLRRRDGDPRRRDRRARLLAPFFGASTIVWANTIGVVLVALSVGYWLGGRLGDRHPDLRRLCLVVLVAASCSALVPFVARPFLDVSVEALDTIEAGAFVGSLFGVLVAGRGPGGCCSAPCSPWAIRLRVRDVEHAGAVAGRLYAISTVGSLLGTMLAALVLIPLVGHAAHVPRLRARCSRWSPRLGLGWRYLAVARAVAAALAIPVGTVKATDDGRVIYETETEYQYVRVVEEADGDAHAGAERGPGRSTRSTGRGLVAHRRLLGRLARAAVRRARPGRRERVAILGNAAGTTARAYGQYFPATADRRRRDRSGARRRSGASTSTWTRTRT